MTREEAIETIRRCCPKMGDSQCDFESALRELIPELRESEDERIRKGLIKALKTSKTVGELKFILPESTREECITWLEKQKALFESGIGLYYYDGEKTTYCGYPATEENPYDFAISQQEQEPTKWSDTNELVFKDICKHLKEEGYNGWIVLLNALRNGEFQPKQEWSEEDEKDMAHIIRILDDCYAYGRHDLSKTDHDNLTSTIKSLRPSWKPSEEQMEVLQTAERLVRANNYPENAKILTELYKQLKAL